MCNLSLFNSYTYGKCVLVTYLEIQYLFCIVNQVKKTTIILSWLLNKNLKSLTQKL